MPSYVTASMEHFDLISQHRIRVINGEAITTVYERGMEVRATLAHLITNKHRSTKLSHKNGNPLDVRPDNLMMPFAKTLNTTFIRDGVGVLVLKKGLEVIMDKEDLWFVEQFNWSCSQKKNGLSVYTYRQEGEEYRRVDLGRYIMGLTTNRDKSVIHTNGNLTDYRRETLRIVEKRFAREFLDVTRECDN